MNQGLVGSVVAAGASIAVSAAIAGPSVAGATPIATTAPPQPKAGTYEGRTSQGLRLRLVVARSQSRLTMMRFSFRLHCADHRALVYTVAPVLARQPWRLNTQRGIGFTRAFHDTTGERYSMAGLFADGDSVSGKLSTRWRSPHDGLCTSGTVRWHARLRDPMR